ISALAIHPDIVVDDPCSLDARRARRRPTRNRLAKPAREGVPERRVAVRSGSMSRFIQSNGLRMHLVEEGSGPLVVLLHGFPELPSTWRHQLRALSAAGYRAVAPDQRGYGQTDCPEREDAYTMFHLVGDVIGLLDALGEREAVVVGHDWGAPVAWNAAL